MSRLLAAAQRVHVDGQHLDGRVVQPVGPGGHHAVLRLVDLRDDFGPLAAEQPDLVVERRRAELRNAAAVLAVARRALGGEDRGAALGRRQRGFDAIMSPGQKTYPASFSPSQTRLASASNQSPCAASS